MNFNIKYHMGFLCLFFLNFIIFSNIFASFSFNLSSKFINLNENNLTIIAKVRNLSQKPMALTLQVETKEFSITGSESNTPLDDGLFLIYPFQLVLMPNESELVQVSWIGPTDLNKDLMYRLACKEIPLSQPEITKQEGASHSAQITFVTQYKLNLFIIGKNTSSEPYLKETQFFKKESDTFARFTLANKGNGIFTTKHLRFYLFDKSSKQDISLLSTGKVSIAPNSMRYIDMKLDKGSENFTKDARFTYEKSKL